MSVLKEVDDEWILRRLERWGKKDNMPFLGPQKAGILQEIIRDKQPQLVVEVGGMCGYSALKMSQVLPKGVVSSVSHSTVWHRFEESACNYYALLCSFDILAIIDYVKSVHTERPVALLQAHHTLVQ